jgi:hypothetical protein
LCCLGHGLYLSFLWKDVPCCIFLPPKDMNTVVCLQYRIIILCDECRLSLPAAIPTHVCENQPWATAYALSEAMVYQTHVTKACLK